MPRKLMAKYECSRCTREWYEEFQKGVEPLEPASFKMELMLPGSLPETAGKTIEVNYPELCKSCTKTIRNYIDSIAKHLEKKSPDRAKKEASEDAPADGSTKPTQPAAPSPSRTSSVGSTAG